MRRTRLSVKNVSSKIFGWFNHVIDRIGKLVGKLTGSQTQKAIVILLFVQFVKLIVEQKWEVYESDEPQI